MTDHAPAHAAEWQRPLWWDAGGGSHLHAASGSRQWPVPAHAPAPRTLWRALLRHFRGARCMIPTVALSRDTATRSTKYRRYAPMQNLWAWISGTRHRPTTAHGRLPTLVGEPNGTLVMPSVNSVARRSRSPKSTHMFGLSGEPRTGSSRRAKTWCSVRPRVSTPGARCSCKTLAAASSGGGSSCPPPYSPASPTGSVASRSAPEPMVAPSVWRC